MKKLLFSLLSIGVVSAIAIGATRAYFTDREVLGENEISTGRVDVDIRGPYSDGIIIPVDTTQTFEGGLFPGREFGEFAIQVYNQGWGMSTTPIKYSWTSEYTGGSEDLYNKLMVKVREGNCDWDPSTAGNTLKDYVYLKNMGRVASLSNLGVNITRCTWFWFKLPANADNSYQGLTTQFNLILDATQYDNPGWNE